ncbi:MAG: hypothetical protein AAFY82_04010 [Pseudomonadota bacterium]
MSDAISSHSTLESAALDPDRPWIEREEDLPSRMDWFATFLNPMGESPKLHFTRAWTFLFFAGVLTWGGLGFIIFTVGITGSETSGLSAAHAYLTAFVIGISAVFSFVIHARRLNHAKKSSIRAIIILVPLVLGAVVFMSGVNQKAAQYQELYDARTEYLADPVAWRDARLQERRDEQARVDKERAAAEQRRSAQGSVRDATSQSANRPGQRRRGGRGRGRGGGGQSAEIAGFSPENPLPSKESFILRPNLGSFYMPIILLNGLIMIWSLLWVARVPNFKRKDQVAYRDPA